MSDEMNREWEEFVVRGGQLYHSIEVTKNTKGYNWKVKIAGGNKEQALKELVEIEAFCKNKYGEQ